MADCLTIPQANDFLSSNANMIAGNIIKSLAINNPYFNIILTDTFRSGMSDVQRSIVQQRVAPVISQANPVWSSFDCDESPDEIETGTDEYQYSLSLHREIGPTICVTTAYSAFRNAIVQTERSIVDHVQTLWTSWLRYQLLSLSATKVVAYSGAASFMDILTTGFQTNFAAGVTPDSPLSFKFLKFLANYLTHSLLAGPEYQWGNGMDAHFRVITDQNTIDQIRNEIALDLRAGVTGGYRDKYDELFGYTFDGPYRGLAFGVDQSLIRASSVNADGTINYVEPFISDAATKGTKAVVNPSWLTAPYQVSFLCAKGSFTRQLPEELMAQGMTKFMKQFWGGDVRWLNVVDRDCNPYGDKGNHIYQLAAAMRPERPEFIIPILHVRCIDDLGLTNCTPQAYYSASL